MSDTEAPEPEPEPVTAARPEPGNKFDFSKYKTEEKSHQVGFKSKSGKSIEIKCNPNHRTRKSPYTKVQLKRMIGESHKTDPNIVKRVHRLMRRGNDFDTAMKKYKKQGYKSRDRNANSPQ